MRTIARLTLAASAALAALALAACDQATTPPAPRAPVPATSTSEPPSMTPPALAAGESGQAVSGVALLHGDTIATSKGPLTIMPLEHASFFMGFAGKVIAVDPTMDALKHGGLLPKADYVFVTDIHPDHLDRSALDVVGTKAAIFVGPAAVSAQREMTRTLANGEKQTIDAFTVEGVPMYNLTRGPKPGALFHDKGRGDGFVFTFGDKRVYVSGDTECTPEMKSLASIDVAFLCMNLPYTMPPDEAATCARAFKPKIVYPYHYRGQDPKTFAAALAGTGTDVRLREWYPAAP